MSANLISPEEFAELTGAIQPAKQCDVLRRNGIKFTTRADGKPSLSWEAYNRQLSSTKAVDTQEREGPRFNAA